MASNEPGLAPLSAPAFDPTKGAVDVPVEDTPVAPDQFDERFETSRWELWAYYWYATTNVVCHLVQSINRTPRG
ncbi:hypothetical protein P3342_007268 [Pyrenophora teres f. teres]|nr:hypothetical protein P3342_007268 [Pyrenophora teres f. teres]